MVLLDGIIVHFLWFIRLT